MFKKNRYVIMINLTTGEDFMKEKVTMIKQDYVPREAKESPIYELESMDQLRESPLYTVAVNGKKLRTYHNEFFDFVLPVVEEGEELNIEIKIDDVFEKAALRPLTAGYTPDRKDNLVKLHLEKPEKVVLELDDDLECPLYILCSCRIPKPERVTYEFNKGQVYNIGRLELKTDDVVYLEEGSVVSGQFYSRMANRIQILGNGILYGGNWHSWYENSGEQMIVTVLGEDIRMEGITVVDGGSWHVVPVACRNVEIQNLNIMSRVITGDGMDIVGCEHVKVGDCFIRANDDCISIKAEEFQDPSGCCDVKHILVENCIFWNAEFGNTLEIGYETRCDEISDVMFRNCDVVHCQYEGNQSGGVLTIHNADRAYIHDIYYEDIRIEDAQEKFIDIKTLDSKYSRDRVRGMICDIYFKNIKITGGKFPVSIIRGFEMTNEVCRPHDVYFEHVEVLGEMMEDANQLRMVAELCGGLHFTDGPGT